MDSFDALDYAARLVAVQQLQRDFDAALLGHIVRVTVAAIQGDELSDYDKAMSLALGVTDDEGGDGSR